MAEIIKEMDAGFFSTPEYQDLFLYRYETEDEGTTAGEGIFLDEIGYYRMFKVEYLQKEGFIPMAIKVDFNAGVYAYTVEGARTVYDLQDRIVSTIVAYGLGPSGSASYSLGQECIASLKEKGIRFYNNTKLPAYINQLGELHIYENSAVAIYTWLYEKFGTKTPVEFLYTAQQRVLPEGQSVIIDYDNSHILEVYAALSYQEELSYRDANLLYDSLTSLAETNTRLQNILAAPIIRLITLAPKYPSGIWISINGYQVTGPLSSVTEEGTNQHYAQAVTHCNGMELYFYPNEQPLVENQWEYDTSRYVTFYNYPVTGAINVDGITPGNYRNGTLYDSLGYTAISKPYEVIGIAPTGRGIAEDYPDWPNDGTGLPMGDDDPEDPFNQPYVWRGKYPPDINIPIPPVIGVPDDPIEDIPSESTVPSVEGIEGEFGFFNVFKISFPKLSELGQFLWQEDTITALLNTFKNDPMQAIISLHQLYIEPIALQEKPLRLGLVQVKNVDSTDMYLPYINDRYIHLDCGEKIIKPYFDDVRDYQTQLTVYLPFIGMRQLDIKEFLGRALHIDYYVDVYTGDCVATISSAQALKGRKVLYQFNGNCSSPLPLTAADKSRLYGAVAQIGTGLVSAAAGAFTHNPLKTVRGLGDAAQSAIGMATNHNITIEKSGNIGGNFGAMAYKKPYIILSRPQPYDAVKRDQINGLPANLTVTLSQVKGYVRVLDVHVDNIVGASDNEKRMIDSLLREGVII